MEIYVLLFLSLASLGVLTFLLTRSQKIQSQLTQSLQSQLDESRAEKRDLLNRMMARDLPSYQSMTHLSATNSVDYPSDPYVVMSDAAEVQRLVQATGYGEPIYDEETDLQQVLSEMTGQLPGEGG